ncbi:MAG: B12-binding domain-containing protein [Candidatus Thorarchaeota archaeon]
MTLKEVTDAVVQLEVDDIAEIVKKNIDAGSDPQDVLQALSEGMNEVGTLYEKNEYFLAELVLAGETMKEAVAVLEPHLKADEMIEREKVIAATVKGDNHDIGKNILITMLMSAGYDVIDLGMDCPAEKVVEAVKKSGARIVALSCLLTMTLNEIRVIGNALSDAGLRNNVKIIVGGAPLSMDLAKKMGADDFGADAIDGVRRIRALLEG